MTDAGDGWDGSEPLPHRPAPHPDDRLWRHPAELGQAAGVRRRRRRHRRALFGGACAVTCVAAGTVARVLVSPTTGPPPVAVEVPAVALAPAVGNSVVRVMVSGPGGVATQGAGLVAGDDRTVVTACRLIAAAQPGSPVEVQSAAHGTVLATVIGVDAVTGVAVLRTATPVGRAAPVNAGVAVIAGRNLAAVTAPAASEAVAATEVKALDSDDGTGAGPAGWTLSGDLDGWWGAPLLDSAGRVVAVVSATEWGTAVAVPAATAVDVARQMVITGRVVHGWIGLHAGLSGGRLTVTRVDGGGPAAAAGLRAGEVIASVDGSPAKDPAQLMATVRMARPGEVVELGVIDGGRRVNAAVLVAEAPGG